MRPVQTAVASRPGHSAVRSDRLETVSLERADEEHTCKIDSKQKKQGLHAPDVIVRERDPPQRAAGVRVIVQEMQEIPHILPAAEQLLLKGGVLAGGSEAKQEETEGGKKASAINCAGSSHWKQQEAFAERESRL